MSSSPTSNDNKSKYMSPRFIQMVKQKLKDYVTSKKQVSDFSNDSIDDSASSSDDESVNNDVNNNTATV